MTRKFLRFMVTGGNPPPRHRRGVRFEDTALRADRRGRVRGATYEQATGEEPIRHVREFGETWDRNAQPGRRNRRR
jgi:hypothetical protein